MSSEDPTSTEVFSLVVDNVEVFSPEVDEETKMKVCPLELGGAPWVKVFSVEVEDSFVDPNISTGEDVITIGVEVAKLVASGDAFETLGAFMVDVVTSMAAPVFTLGQVVAFCGSSALLSCLLDFQSDP